MAVDFRKSTLVDLVLLYFLVQCCTKFTMLASNCCLNSKLYIFDEKTHRKFDKICL